LSFNLTLGKQKGVLLDTRVRCHVFQIDLFFISNSDKMICLNLKFYLQGAWLSNI